MGAVGLRLQLEVEPAEPEAAAECMVVRLGDKVVEVGQLVVERLVAAAEQLRVVARCRHSGNFYRAPLGRYPRISQSCVFVAHSTFRFYCFCSFYFSCVFALMSTNLLQ